ncbi:UTP--glucose-1-phosphate uridylyltransferase GalU [Bermanella marisrubri]|uniref:UTP--glucose-1-phosphate uridylyltransferase n=1 Tax=Bermanella marisrubri TaxID=207949 RepID=Q1MY83_9GAMM|nr:UTP--glucose-1-phosphate uridylyltransferase GalU [Bermanella marisrubri]EAT10927.1 UTP-glucose-1-phosphate uridylyltransferase [Oceanobacter sp. RED65] [Bermanella marisrubri]QIZ83730.1 UTP--glucose-1-phosphate uridylyltransferase GalU [Bermanella marisrubri]
MISKCLFPVAGYGSRFLPATKAMPKEMLPIVNKPLVQYGVEEAVEAGLNDMGFVTGRGKRAIVDHFDMSYELEKEIAGSGKEAMLEPVTNLIEQNDFAFTRQVHMKGLGHAILSGKNLMGDNPFAVILADDLCIPEPGDIGVLAQMVEIYKQFRCSVVAIQEVPMDEVHKYGVIDGQDMGNGIFRVSDMVEKPAKEDAPTNLAIIGRYILTPDIFDKIADTQPGKNGEVQITDAIMKQAQQGCVIAYKFRGKRFDCGSIDGFVEATNYVYDNIYKQGL